MNQKEEYNYKQTRDDRKIDNYFKKISDNTKNDLACEFIIELEDKKYWYFSKNLYQHDIIDNDTIKDLKDNYDWSKDNDRRSIEKDDFEL